MIPIAKPETAPEILITRGENAKVRLCQQFDAGVRQFVFDNCIYGDDTVKKALVEAQNGKCCFCEVIVKKDGDVEHFRPKGGFRQDDESDLEQPGYYWLAYDWDNLLLCCKSCNQRHKSNKFPLIDASKRARCHTDLWTDEYPYFIHPAKEDPRLHITFVGHNLRGRTPRGERTLEALGLLVPEEEEQIQDWSGRGVWEQRRQRFQTIVRVLAWRQRAIERGDAEDVQEASAILDEYLQSNAEFLGMSRTVIAAGGYPVPTT
jgi:uncharacterized protein (TIGR02646 family)